MMIYHPRLRFRLPAALIILVIGFAGHAAAQKRDNLTDAETELIRYHRELDKRVDVLIKAADRRFAVINGTKPPATKRRFVRAAFFEVNHEAAVSSWVTPSVLRVGSAASWVSG